MAQVFFDVPEMDFSEQVNLMSYEEAERLDHEAKAELKEDWRKFVEGAKKNPSMLSCWDMNISFDEFARRVEAGEYD